MASERNPVLIYALAFQCILLIQCVSAQDLGNSLVNFQCEVLPAEKCAFAVGAGGFRCVLETAIHMDGSMTYKCQTLWLQLQVGSDANPSYIETDECLNACGLQRLTVGISTDDILQDNSFREKLCSPNCKQRCANIIDHYGTIMAEEGEDLSRVCQNLAEYHHAERKQEQQHVDSLSIKSSRRQVSTSNKRHEGLYEQAPGPSSGLSGS